MSYRKSFLVFVLAFAALTLGRNQEALGQWDWGWGDAPFVIDGGSTNLVYKCTEGQGTNTLTVGKYKDTFETDGNIICKFEGGQVTGTDQCSYNLTWKGDLFSCVDTSGGAVVTVRAKCSDVDDENFSVSGQLFCPKLGVKGVTDFLGISNKQECKNVFGNGMDAEILFTSFTVKDKLCNQLTFTNEGTKLGGLTNVLTHVCHSDGKKYVDCETMTGEKNKSNSDIQNVAEVGECVASSGSWNVKTPCHDNGVGRVCMVSGGENAYSFDVTTVVPETATLNGVPVNLKKGQAECKITDCNNDGQLDLQCEFPTCFKGEPTAAGGELTMTVDFPGSLGALQCFPPATVKTTGNK